MESAIPAHLIKERIVPKNMPEGFSPPFASYVARFKPATQTVVMAYFGIQFTEEWPAGAVSAREWLEQKFVSTSGPGHSDRAFYVDRQGFSNWIVAAYWHDAATFDDWFSSAKDDWMASDRILEGYGKFIEIARPSVADFETLFSSRTHLEGVAVVADDMSGEVQEHSYWGGTRDRIAASQTSELAPSSNAMEVVHRGTILSVVPHDNVCLIRSGQDWSETEGDDRSLYLAEVEPILRQGMNFLSDAGRAIGCYTNRYVNNVGRDGLQQEKSYGLSWWSGLKSLEEWASRHSTHVKIFGAAMRYLSKVGPDGKLRLNHEVTVAKAENLLFEYQNCHQETGLLNSVEKQPEAAMKERSQKEL